MFGFMSDQISTAFRDSIKTGLGHERVTRLFLPPLPGHPETYFRCSSVSKVCSRATAIQIRDRVEQSSVIDAKLSFVFAKGSAYHRMHQQEIMPVVLGEGLLGHWSHEGRYAGVVHEDGRPELLSRSEAAGRLSVEPELLQYEEAPVYGHGPWIWLSGHMDAVIDWDRVPLTFQGKPSGLEIMDLKSRAGEWWGWRSVDPAVGGKPLKDNVFQIQAYMWLLGVPSGRLAYLRKVESKIGDQDLETDYAEHVLTLEDDDRDRLRGYMREIWRRVMRAWVLGELPARTRCSDMSSGSAKRCGVRHACFERSPRAGVAASYRGVDPDRYVSVREEALRRIRVLVDQGLIEAQEVGL